MIFYFVSEKKLFNYYLVLLEKLFIFEINLFYSFFFKNEYKIFWFKVVILELKKWFFLYI